MKINQTDMSAPNNPKLLIRGCYRLWLLTTLALLSCSTAHGETTAQTNLASMTVTPLTRQAGFKACWQTIYDYAGGVLPPGTRITSEGKWIDPPVHQDQTGVTFAFPDLPDKPENAQQLKIAFAVDRPLADYPTRITISYTSSFDQTMPREWSPFLLTTNNDQRTLFGSLLNTSGGKRTPRQRPNDKPQPVPTAADIPLKTVGDNTFIATLDGQNEPSITMNGRDATDFFIGRRAQGIEKLRPGAMLMNGLSLQNDITQFPHNKGNWFAVHAFKIEQMRPPLDVSSEAAVDLTVPGSEPVRVTIEVVDDKSDSKGYVLRDALVAPGQYRLYWDGIDQNSFRAGDTTWVNSGSYTFRLTSSKTAVHYAGEISNSGPKYSTLSYILTNATALAMTPPGTAAPTSVRSRKWTDINNADDTRKLDTTDSVQMLLAPNDASHGQWIAAGGAVIQTETGSVDMMLGRALAMTPPDPSDPANPEKQFYFASLSSRGGNAVIGCAFHAARAGRPAAKILSSPDWNRTRPGFVPYQIQIGQIPDMLGQQHYLFFKTANAPAGESSHDNFVFRNVRLYEEGSPDPGPLTFDPARFSVRSQPHYVRKTGAAAAAPNPVAPGIVLVEDNGHAVHLLNALTVNYPLNYTITPNTILAFELNRVECVPGIGHGIGLSPDVSKTTKGDALHYFDFMMGDTGHDPGAGVKDPAHGAYPYPSYEPNTLYTDTVPLPPTEGSHGKTSIEEVKLLWRPGFYGLKIGEDGKYLFACNNADNRLEVRDISTDGRAIAKIPIDYPMYVTLAPEGAAGAAAGTRYVYADSPKAGLVRIAWNLTGNTFGKPETLTAASEFAYPRGLVYNAAAGRILVCDAFDLGRSKAANQIVVIDPKNGAVLSRFGKRGGVDPETGGRIDDETFTCPLTIDADSKGAIWVNDFFSCETRKYAFDPASNGFKLQQRVEGPNYTAISHFFWMPDAPPTQVWTWSDFLVRNEADLDADGRYTDQRATSALYPITRLEGRPWPHFSKVDGHLYATFDGTKWINEQIGDGWVPRFAYGGKMSLQKGKYDTTKESVARDAGLLARPGQPPTDLDKAIAASGDSNWEDRPWFWSDLNGDGKVQYTADNPELKIDFNATISIPGYLPSTCFRASDGAFICPCNGKKGSPCSLLVIPPQMVNGKPSYDWKNAKTIPCTDGPWISDVLAQDGRFYVLRNEHRQAFGETNLLECYDESGKLLWKREHNNLSLQSLQPFGEGMLTIMDRGNEAIGPVMIRTKDGDLVSHVTCRDRGDCWANGTLRTDADTGYIGMVQAYKVTGLSTVQSAAATVNLSRAGK